MKIVVYLQFPNVEFHMRINTQCLAYCKKQPLDRANGAHLPKIWL